LNAVILALTPLERWAAAKEGGSNALTNRWFIIAGISAILILTVLLFATSFNRNKRGQEASDRLYSEYAAKRGLSNRERQILRELARKAGLKRSESIFTLGTAFDRGAARMIEESLADPSELFFLREKLGYRKAPNSSANSPAASTKLSSRSIAVGKKVHITRRKTPSSDRIESIVVKNNADGLSVKLKESVRITFGESWCIRYNFGPSVREFDTTVISYDGNMLVLNHSENVRFINRRRFLRVPVARPAMVASFPFARTLAEASGLSRGLPQFVPAVVTELAGPGLRIESSLDVKIDQRVLVVFDLHHDHGLIPTNPDSRQLAHRIVEDIGIVRHARPIENGFSIAVELTGLSDSNIDELTRVTNAASRSTGVNNKNIPTSGDAVESVPEHVGV
jgi:hypothetical protein